MKAITYAATFYDAKGEWVDRNEDHENYAAARADAERNTLEGGYSLIERYEPVEEVRWTKKFKTTEA
jgi:hypothetical protein